MVSRIDGARHLMDVSPRPLDHYQAQRNSLTTRCTSTAPFSPTIGRNETMRKIAAPATTFKFLSKGATPPTIATESPEKHGFPPGKHWVDYAGDFAAADPGKAGSIIVIEQPGDQYCAVTGGIMATRMKVLGLKGAVVGGRIRDLRELQATGLPVGLETFFLSLKKGTGLQTNHLYRFGLGPHRRWGLVLKLKLQRAMCPSLLEASLSLR